MQKIEQIPEDRFLAYDIETASPDPVPEGSDAYKCAISPSYSKLQMISYQIGINGTPQLVETEDQSTTFLAMLRDPYVIKIGYNNVNFDDIVLWRHGYYVEPRNRFDMYLALKTVNPGLPSYSLKFANWYYLGDCHEPERRLWGWLKRHRKQDRMYGAPHELLANYCKHDVTQTVNIFRLVWEMVQEPKHWEVYTGLEMAMAEPLHEMIMLGKEFVNLQDIEQQIQKLEKEKEEWNRRGVELSGGKIENCASSKQVADYLTKIDNVELEFSEKGHLLVRKSDLLAFIDLDDESKDKNPIARCVYEVRDIAKTIGYLRSFVNCGRYEEWRTNGVSSTGEDSKICAVNSPGSFSERRPGHSNLSVQKNNHLTKIAKSYSLSGARTRRFLSSSAFGINFQNQSKRSKEVLLVPPGWLGVWIDSTQIENVVHIHLSGDEERRAAYEDNPDWSEYVWLCNRILDKDQTRGELEQIKSPVNPNWSIYKQFKTTLLALNFGSGADKFAKLTGIGKKEAKASFEQVHKACPAIRRLQNIVREKLDREGSVTDDFGHTYTGSSRQIYRVVSFLVQGMGTGSFPKAMTIANYETLHSLDSKPCKYAPCIWHRYKKINQYATLCGTTHDECALRISLGLPTEVILRLVRELLYNMTEKFSNKVGGIPLRAKIAFSITNNADQKELDHREKGFENELTNNYIEPGKKAYRNRVSYHLGN